LTSDPPPKGVPELVVWLAAIGAIWYLAPTLADWGQHDSYSSPVAERDEGSGIGAWIDSWVEW